MFKETVLDIFTYKLFFVLFWIVLARVTTLVLVFFPFISCPGDLRESEWKSVQIPFLDSSLQIKCPHWKVYFHFDNDSF